MKLAKLSLAAIMTVGAISAANAQPLEDAIKGVDFSGFARYRYHNIESNDVSAGNNDYDLMGKIVAPVTSDLKFTAIFTSGGSTDNYKAGGTDGQPAGVGKMWFTYNKDALTVTAGKQALGTPFTVNSYRGGKGTGIVGMYNLGSVTLAGAYFNSTNLDGTGDDISGVDISQNEINVLAAIGSFGPVNAQLWAARVVDVVDHLVFLQVDGKFAGVSLTGQVINTKLDDKVLGVAGATDDTGTFYALKAGYAMDNFSVNAGYMSNDEDQPLHSLGDNANTDVISAGYRLNDDVDGASFAGGDQYFIDGSVSFGKVGLLAGYAVLDLDTATDSDVTEIWGGVSYQYAKNFNTYVKYSDIDADDDTDDQEFLRFEAKYSF